MVSDENIKYVHALEKQIGKVLYFSEMENISDSVAVHEVRKSFKRLRALLRFLPEERVTYKAQVTDRIVEFGRLLSAYRNYCVNIQIFDRIIKESPHISEKRLRQIKELMVNKCQEVLEFEVLEGKVRLQILDYFKILEKDIKAAHILHNRNTIIQHYIDSYKRCLEIYSNENLFIESKKLHSLRKRLKVLFYQTNFLKFINPRYFKARSGQLDIITELMGEEHDFYELNMELQKEDYGLNTEELDVLRNKIRHQQDLIIVKLQPRLKQLFTDNLEEFSGRMYELLGPG